MLDPVGLRVRKFEVAAGFCSAVLQPSGTVVDASGTGFGPPKSPALRSYESASNERSHREGIEAGGRDDDVPRLRADYDANHHSASWIDPDGGDLEADCLREET